MSTPDLTEAIRRARGSNLKKLLEHFSRAININLKREQILAAAVQPRLLGDEQHPHEVIPGKLWVFVAQQHNTRTLGLRIQLENGLMYETKRTMQLTHQHARQELLHIVLVTAIFLSKNQHMLLVGTPANYWHPEL